MKSLRLNVGGPAYLQKLKEINPNLAKGVEKMRSQFKGENLSTFDKRGNIELANFGNLNKFQQEKYLQDMSAQFAEPSEETIKTTREGLSSKRYTPFAYRYKGFRKPEEKKEEDIYVRLGMKKPKGMMDGGEVRGKGIAIKGTKYQGVF